MNHTATDVRLIEVAIRLFAHHGFHGTSVRRITREAGTNLGAVTYHFGGKRELYEQAFVACIGPLAERLGRTLAGEGEPLARLEAALELFMEYLQERPELPQLMLQETVAGRRPPPRALALLQGILGGLARVIGEGQAAGEIRGGDPRLMAVSVVSQPLHLTVATRVIEGLEPGDPKTRARLLEHARSFIRHGLGPGLDSTVEEA
ncbi:MAG: TetR family transcriptional regulator [Gemmatimonadetes bacterium]|nr:TetR family transcriptional regulator [Gemmatimonadota bacterium]